MAASAAVLRDMHEEVRTGIVPVEFATTDRICQRWAVSVGTGVQSDKWQDGGKTPPPPLDDDTAIIVDQIILHCPEKTKRIIVKWYRTNLPNTVIAQQVNLTPRTLETAWKLSLNFLQWKFSESRHKPLLGMLRFRDLHPI